MSDHIRITKSEGLWVVRAGGAVIGESHDALELTEGDHPMVVYFPRGDIGMAFLDDSDHTTVCPHKGKATYFSIQTKSVLIENAAYSYEEPNPDFEEIGYHLAFQPSDKVAVEKL